MPDIDATKSGTSANCYLTQDEADFAFDLEYQVADQWAGLTDDDKARILITASKLIDSLPVMFVRSVTGQAMKFPVLVLTVERGWNDIKAATYQQAMHILLQSDNIADARSKAIQGISHETLGRVSTSRTNGGFNPLKRFSGAALSIIAPYLRDFNEMRSRHRDAPWLEREPWWTSLNGLNAYPASPWDIAEISYPWSLDTNPKEIA